MLIESLVNFASVGGGLASMASAFSLIGAGTRQKQILELISGVKSEVVRLNERLLYSPWSAPIAPANGQAMPLRDVAQLLDPVQRALGVEIISSGVLPTPEILQQQLNLDPWHCLVDPRPFQFARFDRSSDWVPILFMHENILFVGWQMRGMFRSTLGLRFDDTVEAWKPQAPPVQQTSTPKIKPSRKPSTNPPPPAKTMSPPDEAGLPHNGIVKNWYPQRGFGFIVPADGGPDVFVHISEVERSGAAALEKGREIVFLQRPGKDGRPQAHGLVLKSESPLR